MLKRQLGSTGLEVSVVGFGAMTIGGAFGSVDDAESLQALHAAIDAGMNFIDTSNAYGEGRSESLIGEFLKSRADARDILIFSKGGNNMVTRVRNFSPDYISECLEGSLSRLGVDTIDLYMLHNPSVDNMSAEDSYAVLDKAKADGKIRHWGVSVNSAAECDFACLQGRVAGFQMEYNILNQSAAAAFDNAAKAGLAVISRVPLNRGFLSGRFSPEATFSDDDTRKRSLTPEYLASHAQKLQALRVIADEAGISVAELAVRFCASNPAASCVIPGVRTVAQAHANAGAGAPLSDDVLAAVQAAVA
jgi:aryl-alcohol dehydrogenase-like predicted oxidoreductase